MRRHVVQSKIVVMMRFGRSSMIRRPDVLLAAVCILLPLILAPACVSTPVINMNVKAYSDPDRPPQGIKSFRTIAVNMCQTNELLEKQILSLVRQRLEARGLLFDETNPDALVAVSCYIGPFDQYVPPATIYWPMPNTSTSTSNISGTVGGTP